MTDQQVMEIIRRRMAFVENELTPDPPADRKQWIAAMAEYAEEVARSVYGPEPKSRAVGKPA